MTTNHNNIKIKSPFEQYEFSAQMNRAVVELVHRLPRRQQKIEETILILERIWCLADSTTHSLVVETVNYFHSHEDSLY